MAKATHEEIHVQTVAEIRRLADGFNAERKSKVEERRRLFEASKAGMRTFEVLPPDAAAAHAYAIEKINGYAPEAIRKLLPTTDPDAQLAIEIAGLDIVLHALGQKELAALATEAFERVAAGSDKYRAMLRDYLLLAEHTLAVEQALLDARKALGGVTPPNLVLADLIGVPGRTLFDRRRGSDPLSRERDAALKAGVITESDVRKAREP